MFYRTRTCCFSILLLMSAGFCAGSSAVAQDAAWRVGKASGDVWVTKPGVQPASLSGETTLQPGDAIRTGQTGRVLLLRGKESILISPNSVIGIPTTNADGMSTTIIEHAGSILLEVEKRNVKHFEVDTPYLAAVVKGTHFRVSADDDQSNVNVLRGQVEVKDFKSGQFALVTAGQKAEVSANRSFGLSLSGAGHLGVIQQGAPRSSPVTPVSVRTAGFSAPPIGTHPERVKSLLDSSEQIIPREERRASSTVARDSAPTVRDNEVSEAKTPRQGGFLSPLAVLLEIALFVTFAVTIYRRKQKKSDDHPPEYNY